MKKIILKSFLAVIAAQSAFAQGADEPFFNLRNFYTQGNYGTARSQAMGGAFTALGGDLSNTYINPAGLGFYNRSEFSGTFNFLGSKTTASFNGSQLTRSRSPLDLGQLGIVISNDGAGTRKRKGNFAISYNTLANFTNSYQYGTDRPLSSISDSFTELANGSERTPSQIRADYENYNASTLGGYGMAYMGYLIDSDNNNSSQNYRPTVSDLPNRNSGEVVEQGNLGQINVAYAANFDDKTYIGGSLGIQTLNFRKETKFDEFFASTRQQYYENILNIRGTGLNLSLGVIQRLNDKFNLGASITTPTLMWVTDNFEQYAGAKASTSAGWNDAQTVPDQLKYRITSPLRANVGVSAFLPKKLGVVSVEAEYVGYSRMRIKDKNNSSFSSYQDGLIQDEYRDILNLKAGTEIRAGIGRFRAGLNLFNEALKDSKAFNIKNTSLVWSLGAGIRKSTFFADISYSRRVNTGAYNPYILLDQNKYSSVALNQTRGIVGVTFGSFF